VPNLDLFIYRDFDTLDVELDVGDNAAERLGMDFRDLYVVAVARLFVRAGTRPSSSRPKPDRR
jgi:hypothetical protein